MPEIITCPEPTCGAPAEIAARWTWPSTDGPVEHAQVRCVVGHVFTPTVDSLAWQPDVEPVPGPGPRWQARP